ncbi:MAG: flavodoxin [Clostridia bacterium]|nr:flavodoxin [Clostridia bacterium]
MEKKKMRNIWPSLIIAVVIIAIAFIASRFMFGGGGAIDNEPEAEVTGDSNVLVAYFSWSGNVQKIATWVSEETDGDLFRIVPEEAYGESFDECADRAQQELNDGTRPALSSHIDPEVMAGYDVIYLGFPVWWYDLPMPVWTFLKEYDMEGKTIIPFFSHNGSSNGASSLDTVATLEPNSTLLKDDALSISGSSVAGSEQEVKDWVKEEENK